MALAGHPTCGPAISRPINRIAIEDARMRANPHTLDRNWSHVRAPPGFETLASGCDPRTDNAALKTLVVAPDLLLR
jgi:hypothetical protein